MINWFIGILDDMCNNFLQAGFMLILLFMVIVKPVDLLLSKKRFKNENNRVCLVLIFVGILFLIITIVLQILYKAPVVWYVLSSCLVIAGILGMIPFSFFEKPPGWYKKQLEKKKKSDKIKGTLL